MNKPPCHEAGYSACLRSRACLHALLVHACGYHCQHTTLVVITQLDRQHLGLVFDQVQHTHSCAPHAIVIVMHIFIKHFNL